jgi:pantothenate kinase
LDLLYLVWYKSSMFGIDAGGTYIKFGEPVHDVMEMHPLPYSRDWLQLQCRGGSPPFLITGAGSDTIVNWFPDLKFEKVGELTATGLGGAYLGGVDECIVINIGSGTPILHVCAEGKRVSHLGGSGLGSASVAGLSYYMTGIEDLDRIDEKAFEGDPDKVNLLIQDIYENPEQVKLPGNVTASNFGKYQEWRHIDLGKQPEPKDLLAALHKMIGETIAVMANLAGKQCCKPKLPVVVTGGGTLNRALMKYLDITFAYLDQPFIIPSKAVYSTLHGLFVLKDLI